VSASKNRRHASLRAWPPGRTRPDQVIDLRDAKG
jgi:hypothetical protein